MKSAIFKTFFLSLCIIANTHWAYADTASILPPAKTTFVDQNGKPLTAGTVDFYIPSTTTRKTTWQDAAETISNTNPVVLDAAGRALILGSGSYRQVVKDKLGNVIWDQVTSSAGSGGSTPTATGDGDLVGTVKTWAGLVAPNQYLFTYGQEVSRTTYAALFSAITSLQSVFCSTGTNVLSGLSDTTNFPIGVPVELSCIPGGYSTVISKTSSTVTLFDNSNITANTNARFFPWGDGNRSTTFNLPDFRGLAAIGNNNMGGVASAHMHTNFYSANPNGINAIGGSDNSILLSSNLPAYTPSGTITNGAITSTATGGPSGAINTTTAVSAAGHAFADVGSPITVTSTQAASTFTGTAQGGSSVAFANVTPSNTINYIIKVTPDTNSASASGVTSLGSMTGDIACGAGLTCAGNIISSNLNIFPDNYITAVNATDYGVSSALADNTTALRLALAACPTNGCILYVPGSASPYLFTGALGSSSSILDFSNKQGICLVGDGSASGGATSRTVLTFTGTGTGFFINMGASSISNCVKNLKMSYTNTGFTGTLIKMGFSAGSSGLNYLNNMVLASDTNTTNTATLVGLDSSQTTSIDRVVFNGGAPSIRGVGTVGSFANVVNITNSIFLQHTGYAIRNIGQSWTINANNFEPDKGSAAQAIQNDPAIKYLNLTISNNWIGDATTGNVNVFDLPNGDGLTVSNNYMASASIVTNTMLKLGGVNGYVISGNRIENAINGIDFSSANTAGSIFSNMFVTVTSPVVNCGSAGATTLSFGNNPDLSSCLSAPISSSRAINTTSPLTGGGNLSADRTFACATCVTSSSGGAATGTAPIAVSASGVVSINAPYVSLTASTGGIVYSGATNLAVLSGTATPSLPMLSGSTAAPTWAAIAYPTSATSGGIPYFSSTSAIASSALLGANLLMQGGGAATAPSTFTLGGDCTFTTPNITCTKVNGVTHPSSMTSGGIPYANSTSSVASSALLTASAIMVGGGAATAPSTLASLGTTTTVLHGNAAGNPSFSSVANSDLSTMVTNTVKGNATSGTATPTDLAVATCSTAASALIWTTNTGFGCNTSITANTATTATTATNATNIGITNDTSTNATMFPVWVTANTGNLPSKVTSTKLSFNPSTGALSSTSFIGSGSSLTGVVLSVKKQSFCPSGCTTTVASGGSATYTPTTGTLYAVIECVGSAGGGGSATNASASQIYGGGGGGSGGYSRTVASAATIGASQTVTIGAFGAGGAAGSNNGSSGADVSVGTLCVGKGGTGGAFGSVAQVPTGGAGGIAGTGDVAAAGMSGGFGVYSTSNTAFIPSGFGGSSFFGGGAASISANSGAALAGNAGGAYGSGGSGGHVNSFVGSAAGGNGSVGTVFITEYTNP